MATQQLGALGTCAHDPCWKEGSDRAGQLRWLGACAQALCLTNGELGGLGTRAYDRRWQLGGFNTCARVWCGAAGWA